jgi:hypothetical protein
VIVDGEALPWPVSLLLQCKKGNKLWKIAHKLEHRDFDINIIFFLNKPVIFGKFY